MLHELESVTLYYLGANNAIYEWTISVDDNVLIIKHGQAGGAKITTYEEIDRGKGGRSLYGQIASRMKSRINAQKLKGYKGTEEEAKEGRTNALDLPKPMLAQPWNKVKNILLNDCFVQYKYDGNRCLIVRRGNEVLAYSRKGKLITSISHILQDIDIPEDVVIDGELYAHGVPLPTIRSWISKEQKDTSKLHYHAYDAILPLEYKYRLKFLEQCKFGGAVSIAPTTLFRERELSLSSLMDESRNAGYEGLILRAPGTGYEIGKRSKSLIKVKSFLDAEFVVEDIYLSEKGMPMAMCRVDEHQSFDVVLPGTHEEKFMQYKNKEHHIGNVLTVEFSQWTPDGIPFHAVAKSWREV